MLYRWIFIRMEQNPFNARHVSASQEDALYSLEISPEGVNAKTGWGIRFAEVKLLMQFFDVESPGMLTGKSFVSQKSGAMDALEHFLLEMKNDGVYISPSIDAVRELAVRALAQMQVPDFSLVDSQTIYKAFAPFWTDTGINIGLMNQLKNSISQLSFGGVSLIDAPNDSFFKIRARGLSASLLLIGNGLVVRVIMCPSATPFIFDSE